MKQLLILLLACFALPIYGQEPVAIASEINDLLSRPDDADKQRDVLRLLPKYARQPTARDRLAGNIRFDLLEASDIPLLVRTALEIEARPLKPEDVRPPQRGGVIDPIAQITFWLKRLLLPDPKAFERAMSSVDDDVEYLGPPASFSSSIVTWIEKHNINSPEALAVRAEIERFSAQHGHASPQAKVDPATAAQSLKKASEVKSSISALEQKPIPASSMPWRVTSVVVLAAGVLLYLLFKARKKGA